MSGQLGRPVRLVLAVDGSPSSLEARDLVGDLPWPSGSTITLVSAAEGRIASVAEHRFPADGSSGIEASDRRRVEESLAAIAAPLRDRDWRVELRVVPGRAPSAIVAAADDAEADLVVLGSRGHGAITSMLLGSVGAEVAATTRRSVLIARSGTVTRALVATDGSVCASAIPAVLEGWSVFAGLPATAVSVAPVASPAYELLASLYTLGSEPLARQREALVARHREYGAEMARRLSDAGIPADHELRTGDAAHEILLVARDRGVDLVVTGSRCLGGVGRWLLGSVSRNVLLHASASVLIVRPRADDGAMPV